LVKRPTSSPPRRWSICVVAFQTLAFTGELEDRAMMYESVNDRSGGHGIRENIGPIGERKVRCDSDTASLVSTRINLEE